MTIPLYLNDTYLFESIAQITSVGVDDKGSFIVLNQTIFYPQGGGQPADNGWIKLDNKEIIISFVRQVEQDIRHYGVGIDESGLGATVFCRIDQERRLLNAKYHTGAHLIGNIVEMISPSLKAVKGHSFPGEGYVEFIGTSPLKEENFQNSLNRALENGFMTKTFEMLPTEFEEKFYKLPYPVPANKAFRAMQIADYSPVPCGGTHLLNSSEIKQVRVRKMNQKNDRIKISYEVL